MKRGYFAIYRKFQDNFLWKERRVFSRAETWIDILMNVQHKETPKKVIIGNMVLYCNYAESLKSLETWANRWGWSRSKVKRFLDLCVSEDMIVVKNETVTTRLRVINYKLYDPKRNAIETQSKRNRNAIETQSNTDKNDKNVNNDKNVKDTPLTPHGENCPYDEIINLYHKLLPGLPKVKSVTKNLKTRIKARWKEDKARQVVLWWGDYFNIVNESNWLMGRVKDWNADFHWITGPKNMTKILNGGFENKKHRKAKKNEFSGKKYTGTPENEIKWL